MKKTSKPVEPSSVAFEIDLWGGEVDIKAGSHAFTNVRTYQEGDTFIIEANYKDYSAPSSAPTGKKPS